MSMCSASSAVGGPTSGSRAPGCTSAGRRCCTSSVDGRCRLHGRASSITWRSRRADSNVSRPAWTTPKSPTSCGVSAIRTCGSCSATIRTARRWNSISIRPKQDEIPSRRARAQIPIEPSPPNETKEASMSITRILSVVASTLALAFLPRAAAATEFRSSDIHPDDYPTVQAVRYMGDLVSKRSNGKNSIKVFSKAALGNEKDTIEQTKLGAIAMTRVNVAPMNNICAATMVPTMPFLFRSTEHMRKVLDGPIGDEILKDCETQGFIGLAFYDSGSRSIYSVKKPVKTIADTKGMKIRVQQSDLWVALMEAMGANATPMAFGEVYTALKTGLVDAAENNYPSYESTRHFEVAKYYNKTEHSMAPEILLFSKKVWDTLTPEDQKIIRESAKESVGYMRKLWDEREQKSLAIVTAGGAQIIEVDKTSFQQAMKPVYDKFLADPKLESMVKRIQDTK